MPAGLITFSMAQKRMGLLLKTRRTGKGKEEFTRRKRGREEMMDCWKRMGCGGEKRGGE